MYKLLCIFAPNLYRSDDGEDKDHFKATVDGYKKVNRDCK